MARPTIPMNFKLTNHIYNRFVERMNFKGTIEELATSLNTNLSDGYIINNEKIFFPSMNLMIPYTYDADIKQFIAKTVKQNIGFPKYCQKACITWETGAINLIDKINGAKPCLPAL